MKRCEELIKNIRPIKTIGSVSKNISSICFDSREVVVQSMFVAQKGTQVDGHDYISKAIEKGAYCIVLENLPSQLDDNVTYIQVENSSLALAHIASAFYDYPSQKLKLVGITGTNGKTTTVTLLHKLFLGLGYQAGLLSTIENRINNEIIPSTHTTPDAVSINKLLALMCEKGCEFCFMEVSSHAIVQRRVEGLRFEGGIFSNITHDHLDYHKTFKEYILAKKTFFDTLPSHAFALSNIDDANGKIMLQNTKAKKYFYGLLSGATDFKAKITEHDFRGMQLDINEHKVWVKLTGVFNAYNTLAIYATARLLGINDNKILKVLSSLNPAEGRFETYVGKNNITAIVDYAHTPDALENVLKTIRKIRKSKQNIITVVGSGGNRDKSKRSEMAKISYDLSDKLILTSDNPRDEDPDEIIKDMLKGTPNDEKVLVVSDREQAIKTAVLLAHKDDVILIAGKGHEKYQEIKGVKRHFSDAEVVIKYLKIN
ncbi:MAG: UDP-N-acetylmuramoyl-L-alanyl-D-glutamate--2,6-diaminopimelate ligase [Bacteroidales bacterium]|nr:UDP-N-acetylmuramoyl-L-alanyl-D-glutamate--2,6-diaminopimelate ligase [Bacteroidales bacterium]